MNFPLVLYKLTYFIIYPRVLALSVIRLDEAYCNAPVFLQLVCNRRINV